LVEIILLVSVEVWRRDAFISADHFPRLHLNQTRDCHELKRRHALELSCWNHSSFIGWSLGSEVLLWMRITFLDYIWIKVEIVSSWRVGILWDWLR
jgi:hypothetical protein